MRPRFGLTRGGAGFVTREEMVAARGGAAPTHAGLLALGYPGWSDLRRHRPPAP